MPKIYRAVESRQIAGISRSTGSYLVAHGGVRPAIGGDGERGRENLYDLAGVLAMRTYAVLAPLVGQAPAMTAARAVQAADDIDAAISDGRQFLVVRHKGVSGLMTRAEAKARLGDLVDETLDRTLVIDIAKLRAELLERSAAQQAK